MFGSNQRVEVGILESKFEIYEELSKQMLEKLERAVDKISEGNSSIAQILAKHEERLMSADRADALLVKMIEELKIQSKEDESYLSTRIEALAKRIDDLAKFRWISVGVATAAMVVIGSASFFGNMLTVGSSPANVSTGEQQTTVR